jgi:hypothetical protein
VSSWLALISNAGHHRYLSESSMAQLDKTSNNDTTAAVRIGV